MHVHTREPDTSRAYVQCPPNIHSANHVGCAELGPSASSIVLPYVLFRFFGCKNLFAQYPAANSTLPSPVTSKKGNESNPFQSMDVKPSFGKKDKDYETIVKLLRTKKKYYAFGPTLAAK